MTTTDSTYLLDTSVVVDLLRTNSSAIRRRLTQRTKNVVGLSVITLCELQFGLELRANKYPHLRESEQRKLSTILEPFQWFPLTKDVMHSYGGIRSQLQVSGAGIGPLDTLIAAHAVSLDAVLVTSNVQEFRRVPKLRLEDWR
jgi:tRNA(fMet)-specific endonuclease VapC